MSYIGADPNGATSTQLTEVFSGNGSTTAFTLTTAPASASNCRIAISGLVKAAGIDYTLSGKTVTFTSAPASGTNNVVIAYGVELAQGGIVPSDDTITVAKLNSGFIAPVSKGGTGGTTAAGAWSGLNIDGVVAVPSMKNRFLNGHPIISQRGATFTSPASGSYLMDMWALSFSGTAVSTITQNSDVPSTNEFQASCRVAITTADASIAAGDYFVIQKPIEGYTVRDLIGNTFTLSFWVRSTITGVHCVSFTNSASDRSYVVEYTVSSSNTWEYKTVVVPSGLITAGTWNWTTGLGLTVRWALAAGTTYRTTAGAWQTGNYMATTNQVNAINSNSNIFALTGVQLERGSAATPFDHRRYNDELINLKRYYERYTIPPNYTGITGGSFGFNGYAFQTEKRVAPTVTYSSLSYYSGGTSTPFTPNVGTATTQMFTVGYNGATDWRGISAGVAIASAEYTYV